MVDEVDARLKSRILWGTINLIARLYRALLFGFQAWKIQQLLEGVAA